MFIYKFWESDKIKWVLFCETGICANVHVQFSLWTFSSSHSNDQLKYTSFSIFPAGFVITHHLFVREWVINSNPSYEIITDVWHTLLHKSRSHHLLITSIVQDVRYSTNRPFPPHKYPVRMLFCREICARTKWQETWEGEEQSKGREMLSSFRTLSRRSETRESRHDE